MRSSGSARGEDDRPLLLPPGQRLNKLIETLSPDERTRPGYARLAKEIRETTGGAISATCLREPATGKRRNLTLEQPDIRAQVFGVPPESPRSRAPWLRQRAFKKCAGGPGPL